jgi:hypothetical protein
MYKRVQRNGIFKLHFYRLPRGQGSNVTTMSFRCQVSKGARYQLCRARHNVSSALAVVLLHYGTLLAVVPAQLRSGTMLAVVPRWRHNVSSRAASCVGRAVSCAASCTGCAAIVKRRHN